MKFAAEGVSSIMDRPIQIGRLRSDPREKELAGRHSKPARWLPLPAGGSSPASSAWAISCTKLHRAGTIQQRRSKATHLGQRRELRRSKDDVPLTVGRRRSARFGDGQRPKPSEKQRKECPAASRDWYETRPQTYGDERAAERQEQAQQLRCLAARVPGAAAILSAGVKAAVC